MFSLGVLPKSNTPSSFADIFPRCTYLPPAVSAAILPRGSYQPGIPPLPFFGPPLYSIVFSILFPSLSSKTSIPQLWTLFSFSLLNFFFSSIGNAHYVCFPFSVPLLPNPRTTSFSLVRSSSSPDRISFPSRR